MLSLQDLSQPVNNRRFWRALDHHESEALDGTSHTYISTSGHLSLFLAVVLFQILMVLTSGCLGHNSVSPLLFVLC